MVKRVFAALLSSSLFWLAPPSQAQVAAYDRMAMRDVYIIAITDSDSLSVGSHLVINFPDTGESQTVEVVDVSNIGQDLELDLYFSRQNQHYIVEVSRDGISTLFR